MLLKCWQLPVNNYCSNHISTFGRSAWHKISTQGGAALCPECYPPTSISVSPIWIRVPSYCAKVFLFTVFLHPTAIVSTIILIINIIIQGRNNNSFKQCLLLLITSNIEKHKKMIYTLIWSAMLSQTRIKV